MPPAPRVLLYVQHLLGAGHLHRMAALARAMQRHRFDVMLVSGGLPDSTLGALDGIRFEQLPPARAEDASFSRILDADGAIVSEPWWQRRRAQLCALSDTFQPQAVLTELFPFARRPMRHELLPWLQHLHAMPHRPLIFSSVRDILVNRNGGAREQEALGWFRQFYDGAFVHGDPSLIRLDETFPAIAEVAERITYTGYVVEPSALAKTQAGTGEILVSAGGGAVGMDLFRAALAAKPLSAGRALQWRLLVSPREAPDHLEQLRRMADAKTVIEAARPDFKAMLQNCALSISLGGYNTVMEILQAGARAVVVPYAAARETEQTMRAECLARAGYFVCLPEHRLSPDTLAAAIDRALQPRPAALTQIDLGGADCTARILLEKIAS